MYKYKKGIEGHRAEILYQFTDDYLLYLLQDTTLQEIIAEAETKKELVDYALQCQMILIGTL